VTADAGALALKAGNVAILRGGSDSIRSSGAIQKAMAEGLKAAGLPETAVQVVGTTDRAAVGMMLEGLNGSIDLIIPRGGKGLTGRVINEARVPVLAHLEGLCHVYLHAKADLDKSRSIALNAKMRRTSVCGAAETLLVDRAVLKSHGLPVLEDLAKAGCEIRGDDAVRAVYPAAKPATEEDWKTEYLDAIIAVRTVDGLEEAIRHIEHYGSHHTDSIVTEDAAAAETFMNSVDSAIVLWNASTQFADGGNSGWERKSVSAPARCMPVAPWAPSSSPRSNMWCAATGRRGRKVQAMAHQGGCHCGKIAYEFEGEIGAVLECNCSLCSKRGGLLHFIPASQFTLKTPRENLGTYKFNKHLLSHHFCPACGISPFTEGTDPKGNKMVAINVRCVDGVDPRALEIKFFNGRDA
jgi:hypothetical protein